MADLTVDFCGYKFSNPIVLASGYPTGHIGSGATLKMIAEAGAGGITARSVFIDKVDVGMKLRPKYGIDGHHLVHFDAVYETASEFFGKQAEIAKVENVPLIASILGKSINEYRLLGEMAEECSSVDIIEVNVSCPGTEYFGTKIDMMRPNVSQMPDLVEEILHVVRKATSKPLIAKVSAQADNMSKSAQAAVAGGADALAAINTLPNCLAAIDIENGKPGLPILGAYGGAGLRHLALGAVVQIRKAVSVPVLGIGGVFTWRDAVECIMAGASLVGLGTSTLLRGSAVFKEITAGISKFMDSHNYANVKEMCGITLPYVYNLNDVPEFDLSAHINPEVCTRCLVCLEVCAYDAIQIEPDPLIDKKKCVACSLCQNICPVDAITLSGTKKDQP